MVNKNGMIRIVEASIAVLIVISVLIVITYGNRTIKQENMSKIIPPLLDEIAKNSTLRESILEKNSSESEEDVKKFLAQRVKNPLLGFDAKVCSPDELCPLTNFPDSDEIFTDERIIGTSISSADFTPKKVKIFIWTKKR
ncbi:hypothetical protein J4408_00645 [Candidatus Pacearchaeota archaeon]|nr:hypothetical protein [Candidatus Pacearchaeota archaeon]